MSQFITNLWEACEQDEGRIKYFKGSNDYNYPVVCVKRYQSYEWVKLENLSQALWSRYRVNISSDPNFACSQDMSAIASIIQMLSVEQRKVWAINNRKYNLCTECGTFDPEMKGCIHHECKGMCVSCFNKANPEGFENCSCCGQKQETTCPICQEDFTTENLVKSEQCGHYICWACFGRSVKSSRPLSHCPCCRGVFCDKLIDIEDAMPELEDAIPFMSSEQSVMEEAQSFLNWNEMMEVLNSGVTV
jgi:hypothetical protein